MDSIFGHWIEIRKSDCKLNEKMEEQKKKRKSPKNEKQKKKFRSKKFSFNYVRWSILQCNEKIIIIWYDNSIDAICVWITMRNNGISIERNCIRKWMQMHALNSMESSAVVETRIANRNEISKDLTKHIETRTIEIISIFNNCQFPSKTKTFFTHVKTTLIYKAYKVAKQTAYDIWRMTDKISVFFVCFSENLNYYYKSLPKSVTNENRNFAIWEQERSSQVPGVQKSIQWIHSDLISHQNGFVWAQDCNCILFSIEQSSMNDVDDGRIQLELLRRCRLYAKPNSSLVFFFSRSINVTSGITVVKKTNHELGRGATRRESGRWCMMHLACEMEYMYIWSELLAYHYVIIATLEMPCLHFCWRDSV